MFAELPPKDQRERVLKALESLLGDTPTRTDYLMLLIATQEAIDALHKAVRTLPYPQPGRQLNESK